MSYSALNFKVRVEYTIVEIFITDIIRQAGAICLAEQNRLMPEDVSFKSRKDLVTVTDRKVEQFIIDKISAAFPDHGVLGEETGFSSGVSEYCWIIDPIDGTTSYYHRQPFFSVSMALQHSGKTVLGAVFAPALDQLFLANQDAAFLNGDPIQVATARQLNQSVMGTGFACLRSDSKHNNLPYFNALAPLLRDIRRFGSAAIDLCYVGCGKLDGFWELNLNIYDIAAGVLIAQKAGAVITDFSGSDHYPDNGIIASNTVLHSRILEVFSRVNRDRDENNIRKVESTGPAQ